MTTLFLKCTKVHFFKVEFLCQKKSNFVNPDTKINLKKFNFFFGTQIYKRSFVYICVPKKNQLFVWYTNMYALFVDEIPTRISSTILSILRAARAVDREAEIFIFSRETRDNRFET